MCGRNTTFNNKPASRTALGSSAAAFICAGLIGAPAFAQVQNESGQIVLEEITVTAQKREQTLEDVPASVSVVTGESVRDYLGAAENLRALTNRVPSLNIESSNGRTQPRLYIRGLGNIDFDNNASQPVGMVFDDIFLESNVLRSLPLFDIERVEVLMGPQGTLFGRNTNAGLFKIDSVKPSMEKSGYVGLSWGSRNTAAIETAFGGELDDSIAARVALKYQRRDDWIDNLVNGPGDDFGGFSEYAYRMQFLVDPGDNFTGLFKLHGFHQDGSQPQVFYAGAIERTKSGLRSGFDEEVVTQDGAPACDAAGFAFCAGMELDHFGFASNLNWDLGDATFTSITGFDKVENFQSTDVDGGTSAGDFGDLGYQGNFQAGTGDGLRDHHQLTQEFRWAVEGDETFWQVGLYYLADHIEVLSWEFVFPPNSQSVVTQDTKSLAMFGQSEFTVSDRSAVTVGLRYTSEDKDLLVENVMDSFVVDDSIDVDDDFMSWDIAFTYDATDDWSWYGRFANASRGPVTIGRFGFTSSADTETTNSIEFGFKSTILGGNGRWNTSIYSYENDDHQLVATGGVGNANRLMNADKVKGRGLETTLDLIVSDNFFMHMNASYNHTEIDDPDLLDELGGADLTSSTSLDPIIDTTRIGLFGFPVTDVSIDGNPLPRTPEWVFNLILQYNIPVADGDFYINTDWNYRDESNLFLHETVEFVAEARTLGGLRIGYRTDNTDIALVGRNITDEIVVDGGINFINMTAFINEPAFWGLEFRRDW
jgi:iron complex outermembrane receptor protein